NQVQSMKNFGICMITIRFGQQIIFTIYRNKMIISKLEISKKILNILVQVNTVIWRLLLIYLNQNFHPKKLQKPKVRSGQVIQSAHCVSKMKAIEDMKVIQRDKTTESFGCR